MKYHYPDKVDDRAKRYLDVLIYVLNAEPIILSDFREGDPKEHGKGHAIDTTWPTVPPLHVLEVSKDLNLWGGLGIYINEIGAASFHHDIRPHKPDGSIAKWGCLITPGESKRNYNYTTMERVVEMIKAGKVPS